MRKGEVAAIFLVAILIGNGVAAALAEEAMPTKDIFWYVPHTHWEGAVFKTREEYLEMGLPNILRALKLLKQYPSYRFVLDQSCYVQPFLERYPEEVAAFRKFVAEGRLQIVGGAHVMCDDNMPSGESFVRQILYGKNYFRRALGVDVSVGWQLDSFGHNAQLPQIMKLAGYKSFWFFRGVPSWETPSEFLWEGIDGSRIPAFWLPHAYAVIYGSPSNLRGFTQFFKQRYDLLAPFSRGKNRVGLAGADVSEPEEHVPRLAAEFNRQPDAPFEIRIGVPTDFERVVAQRKDQPVLRGEFNPIFQGIYSSRIELKQLTRTLERELTAAEKLGALGNTLGESSDDATLWRAWEAMLFNQTHDLMSGVMTDNVYADTMRGYDFSKRLADEQLTARFTQLSAHVDTRGEGVPILVFNSLGWQRNDIAQVEVRFSEPGVRGLRLLDSAGKSVPLQIVASERHHGGGLMRATIAFAARDVPALGYEVYRLIPLSSPADSDESADDSLPDNALENEFYRVRCDRATGAITSVRCKSGDWEALRAPANVIARHADKGDFWELYRTLDGASRIAMKNPQPVPTRGQAVFSDEQTGKPVAIKRGPVFSEFRAAHPFGANGAFTTTVRLYAGLRRIEFHTRLRNDEKFTRYQVLFPTALATGQSVHEIPFGAIARPPAIEFPAQNWADYGDSAKGVALLNRGQPGNLTTDGVMMLSLMRSTSIVSYGIGGGFEGQSSDSGFELGKELEFDYALVPHAGDWRQAQIFRDGQEFNNPLIAQTVSVHGGKLPKRWGFVEISSPNVILSALKPGPQGTAILRIYEAAGLPAPATKLSFQPKLLAAEEVNLMEDPGAKLKVRANALQVDIKPFEIKTFKLRLRPAR